MERKRRKNVNADKYKRVRKTEKRLYKSVQGVFWRTEIFKTSLKIYTKKENGGFSQAVQRENAVFSVFKSV